jgi:hypothetical protein
LYDANSYDAIPCESEADACSQEIQLIKGFRDLGYELANKTDGGEGLRTEAAIAGAKARGTTGAAGADRCPLVSGGRMGEKALESVKAPRLPGFNQGKTPDSGFASYG